jgi:hypothetical protein
MFFGRAYLVLPGCIVSLGRFRNRRQWQRILALSKGSELTIRGWIAGQWFGGTCRLGKAL